MTGPHLMCSFFTNAEITKLSLCFDGENILLRDRPILTIYKEYRAEQLCNQKTEYYKKMWIKKNIYNYPSLAPKQRITLTEKTTMYVPHDYIQFFSGTPTIIEQPDDTYMVNIRWINYNYNEDGSKKIIPKQWVSLNSRYMLDNKFNRISYELFLHEDFMKEKKYCGIGLEDIRIFKFGDSYYYNASYFDENRQVTSTSSDIYNTYTNGYILDRKIILPKMYDTNKHVICEKNWCMLNYKNELCVVYNWFPLQIGKINYDTRELDIIEIKYNIPNYFKKARGSSPGIRRNDEIWFILHTAQSFADTVKHYYHYQHFFAIFDLDMNLLRYSELFKFEGTKVEFCVSFIFKEEEILLAYSVLDTESIIAIYDMSYIETAIKWYNQ
jgi:hypothetical protein